MQSRQQPKTKRMETEIVKTQEEMLTLYKQNLMQLRLQISNYEQALRYARQAARSLNRVIEKHEESLKEATLWNSGTPTAQQPTT